MLNLNFLPKNKHHLVLSVVALLLTISSFLIISMSLQAAYLWLIIVLIVMLFFTTFTCSSSVYWRRNGVTLNSDRSEDVPTNNTQVCWVIDVPPSYRIATGLPSGETPPPCYRKLSPPPYNEISSKKDNPLSSTEINRNTIPEIFSNVQTTRQDNTASVQSINVNVSAIQSGNI